MATDGQFVASRPPAIPVAEPSTEDSRVSKLVADHYNKLDEKGIEERTKSRIFYMRNFNNFIKSSLIDEYLKKIKSSLAFDRKLTVLDLCCGKGGDLLKWKIGEIDYLVCADIAATSVEQCQKRFEDMVRRTQTEFRGKKLFEAEFIAADCSKECLKDRYRNKNIKFNLVSCQFSFHYCFESLPQVECMLQNVSECLRPGGFFIGTTPDAYQIVHKLQNAEGLSFGNDVFQITFQEKTNLPLFGAKYNFQLEGVVDCPEFLVYFSLLEKMAEKYNLKCVFKARFDDFFSAIMKKDENVTNQYDSARALLKRMQALETYPPFEGTELSSNDEKEYEQAKQKMNELRGTSNRPVRVGTMSQSEWEAICLYIVFAFEKQGDGTDGEYDGPEDWIGSGPKEGEDAIPCTENWDEECVLGEKKDQREAKKRQLAAVPCTENWDEECVLEEKNDQREAKKRRFDDPEVEEPGSKRVK